MDVPEEGRGAYSQNQVTRIDLVPFQFSYPIFCGPKIRFDGSNQGCQDRDVLIDYLLCFDPCVLFCCLVFCSVSSSTERG